jgi:IS30 family transposase
MLDKSYSHLSKIEREEINQLNLAGLSARKIAKKLGRNVSTISRELQRNSLDGKYFAAIAQAGYMARRVKCCKIESDEKLKKYVFEKLQLH